LLVGVRVSPGAKESRVLSEYGGRLKVQIGAPPEQGKANEALLSALARWLDMPPSALALRSGQRSRDKVVAIEGVDSSTLQEKLCRLLHTSGHDQNGEGNGT
jgi:uncharacterized protein